MSFYHVYSAEITEGKSGLLQLRYETAAYSAAQRAATILFSGRIVPARLAPPSALPPGLVTGIPVWVRNKPDQRIVVMITEHPSAAAASAAADVTSRQAGPYSRARMASRQREGRIA